MEEPGAGTENEVEFFLLIFNAGGTMTKQNFQEGEIFAVSKLDKLYVDLTPLGNTNPMAQSISWSEQPICRGPEGWNIWGI